MEKENKTAFEEELDKRRKYRAMMKGEPPLDEAYWAHHNKERNEEWQHMKDENNKHHNELVAKTDNAIAEARKSLTEARKSLTEARKSLTIEL